MLQCQRPLWRTRGAPGVQLRAAAPGRSCKTLAAPSATAATVSKSGNTPPAAEPRVSFGLSSLPRENAHAQCPSAPAGTSWLRQAGLVLAAAATASLLIGPSSLLLPPAADAITTEQLLFLEAWRAVDRAYVDKGFNGQTWFRVREKYLKNEVMDDRQQTYGAIRKLLASLDDPFTRFLDPARLAGIRRSTAGSLTGVGVELTFSQEKGAAGDSDRDLVVVAPSSGGPAEGAGVGPGDIIYAINGRPARGLSLYEASDLLLGKVDTEVTLTIQPRSGGLRKDLVLIRKTLAVNPVSWKRCMAVSPSVGVPAAAATSSSGSDTSIGYIRIATFSSRTQAAFRDALDDLKGVDGLVLDLRNNGGGLFPAGVAVARDLLETGDIVLIADSAGVRDVYSADKSAADSTTPLAVLVNKGTASASEVLAGALKDDKRAWIVGEPTFGKGLIQTVVDLSDGSGVAITVARYQTPAGVDINKVGIKPDALIAADALPISRAGEDMCQALQSDTAPRLYR